MTDNNTTSQITSQWPRIGCVRIMPPDHGEPKSETQPYDAQPLAPLISEIFAETGTSRIELLSWPGVSSDREDSSGQYGQQEWIIYPESRQAPSSAEQAEQLSDQDQREWSNYGTGTSAEREEPDTLLGQTQDICADHLPDEFGFDICDIDFSPIERTIRPTCRLAVRESPDLVPLARKSPHPVVKLIDTLNDRDLPYIFQTIIEQRSDDNYQLSQRLAVYPPKYGIASEQDFISHLQDGPPADLADFYDPDTSRLTSNFSLDDTDYFRIVGEGPDATIKKQHQQSQEAVKQARRVLEGKEECHDLYAGYHDTDKGLENLYRYFSYYTKIPLSERALGGFISLAPGYIKHPPWEKTAYAAPPDIISRPVDLAAGQNAPYRQVIEDDDDPENITRGSDVHIYNEDFVADYYSQRGYEVEQLDIDGNDSVPDLRIQKDGITQLVEVEYENLSRPANILTNAARAAYYDLPVIFVAEKKPEAITIAKKLRKPIKTKTDDGAKLFTQSSGLTLEDGGSPVLPRDAEKQESQWYIRYDGVEESKDGTNSVESVDVTLCLEAGDQTIASGPPDESVASWEYDTNVFETNQSVPDDRIQIHPPFVPSKLTYLQHTEIRYMSGSELKLLEDDEYPTDWNQSDEAGKRERYVNAYKTFIDRYTVSVAGGEIHKQEIFEDFETEFYTPQTSRKAPGDQEAGRALWKHAEQKSRDGNTLDLVKDRVWRWPRGIESPDLPFIGDEELSLDEWE